MTKLEMRNTHRYIRRQKRVYSIVTEYLILKPPDNNQKTVSFYWQEDWDLRY
jgi:hypothetical protein